MHNYHQRQQNRQGITVLLHPSTLQHDHLVVNLLLDLEWPTYLVH